MVCAGAKQQCSSYEREKGASTMTEERQSMSMEEALAMMKRQRLREREAMGYGGHYRRKSKFKWTPKNRLRLAEQVEKQGSYEAACNALGIEPDRFQNFLQMNVMFRIELERRLELFARNSR